MNGRRDGAPRADLAEVAKRFAQWRRTHASGTRIPEWLWDRAVELAVQHGPSRTATTLKLDYYKLERLVAEKSAVAGRRENGVASPAFVELTPAPLTVPCECTIEFEKGGGSRMRIELKGSSIPDLAALGRSFWESP